MDLCPSKYRLPPTGTRSWYMIPIIVCDSKMASLWFGMAYKMAYQYVLQNFDKRYTTERSIIILKRTTNVKGQFFSYFWEILALGFGRNLFWASCRDEFLRHKDNISFSCADLEGGGCHCLHCKIFAKMPRNPSG